VLLDTLAEARRLLGWRAAEVTLAAASVDKLSEAQQRFLKALERLGIMVEAVPFRHAQHAVPLSGATNERQTGPGSSLAPQIAYALGLLADRTAPEVLLVSSDFGLFHPLLDFVRNRGGKAALAFFKRFLEPRWAALLDKPDIRLIDLDPASTKLLGLDLSVPAADEGPSAGGLATL
jgi:hypothetical protein